MKHHSKKWCQIVGTHLVEKPLLNNRESGEWIRIPLSRYKITLQATKEKEKEHRSQPTSCTLVPHVESRTKYFHALASEHEKSLQLSNLSPWSSLFLVLGNACSKKQRTPQSPCCLSRPAWIAFLPLFFFLFAPSIEHTMLWPTVDIGGDD